MLRLTSARLVARGGRPKTPRSFWLEPPSRHPPPSLSTLSHAVSGRSDNKDDDSRRLIVHRALPRIVVRDFSATSGSPDKTTEDEAERLRKEAANMTHSWRERAFLIGDSARGRYAEFKSDPRSSAKAGAKSVAGMVRQYGPVFIGTYLAVYGATLGSLFLGVESGVLDPVGLFSMLGHAGEGAGETKNTVQLVVDFMENHAFTKPYAHIIEKNPSFANLAVAWIAVKFTEPVRLALSITITPRVARTFGFKTKALEEEEAAAAAEKADSGSLSSKDTKN